MGKTKVERRGYRPVFLPVSILTQRHFSCLAILKEMNVEEMISEILINHMKIPIMFRPSSEVNHLLDVPLKRYLLYTKITSQIRSQYSRKKEVLQRFLLGVLKLELDKLHTSECLCGCGAIFNPFINPETKRPRWFVAGHVLHSYQDDRPREIKYIELLKLHGPLPIVTISQLTGDTRKATANFLSELCQLKLITRVGVGIYAAIQE